MSTDNMVEPDAEAYEEDEAARDLAAEEVTGEYIESDKGQDPEATR